MATLRPIMVSSPASDGSSEIATQARATPGV
jgi:hypothetical protein